MPLNLREIVTIGGKMIHYPQRQRDVDNNATLATETERVAVSKAIQEMAETVTPLKPTGAVWIGQQLVAFVQIEGGRLWVHIPDHMRSKVRFPWRQG